MKYGGFTLYKIMKTDRKSKGIKAEMHKMFLENLKHYFKHLLIGLIKMHENKIANRDIKQANIMVYWDANKTDTINTIDNKTMDIKYIDFGLSEFITSDMSKNLENIHLKGTYLYIPPELFISRIINKYNKESYKNQMEHIMVYINKYVKKALHKIGEKDMEHNLDNTVANLYNKIKHLFDKGKLGEAYFGTDKKKYNGYLQKADVYALGITIYETLSYYSNIDVEKNEKLYSLLMHMISLEPDKRYNAIQCLTHPYFKA